MGGAVLLMLIDTRDLPPEPEEGAGSEHWLAAALGWLLPWRALIAWLAMAALFTGGWISIACALGALIVWLWRLDAAPVVGGLRDHRQ